MQNYHPKTPLASALDHLFRALISWLAGTAWFICLWGLSLPALTAGTALGVLLWIAVRQFSKSMTAKKENLMRQMIGGELALERLLLDAPRKAAFQAALWVSQRYHFIMERADGWNMIGTLDHHPAILRLIAQHKSQSISAQQMVECARELRRHGAQHCLVCVTAAVSKEAADYAAGADPPIRIISREELARLAGACSPATDEDLLSIGKQKRTRLSPKEWLAVILDSSRAKRYFWYGIGMSVLALVTGSGYYPIPAAICLGLFIACKMQQFIPLYRRWKG